MLDGSLIFPTTYIMLADVHAIISLYDSGSLYDFGSVGELDL